MHWPGRGRSWRRSGAGGEDRLAAAALVVVLFAYVVHVVDFDWTSSPDGAGTCRVGVLLAAGGRSRSAAGREAVESCLSRGCICRAAL